jgi:hypothetical protein
MIPSARSAASPRFAMPQRESRGMLWVKRMLMVLVGLNVLLFSWSIYRRIWQVLRIELHASSLVLTPGTTVSTDVITSGEVPNPIRLELVQGAHSEMLVELRGGLPTVRSFDPRLFRYTPSVVITPELLARFEPGPAVLRLTGVGMQKLLRTPPPRVRELDVTLPSR